MMKPTKLSNKQQKKLLARIDAVMSATLSELSSRIVEMIQVASISTDPEVLWVLRLQAELISEVYPESEVLIELRETIDQKLGPNLEFN
jgi:hypothetical protein